MIRVLFQIALLLLLPTLGFGEEYSAELVVTGQPVAQWIVISDGENIKKVAAEREGMPGKVIVRAKLNNIRADAMGIFVVVNDKGRVFSTPFSSLKGNDLERESVHLAERQIPILQEELVRERALLQAKQGELNLVNLKKRKEFGLDEVDRVYERIGILKDENQRILAVSEIK